MTKVVKLVWDMFLTVVGVIALVVSGWNIYEGNNTRAIAYLALALAIAADLRNRD